MQARCKRVRMGAAWCKRAWALCVARGRDMSACAWALRDMSAHIGLNCKENEEFFVTHWKSTPSKTAARPAICTACLTLNPNWSSEWKLDEKSKVFANLAASKHTKIAMIWPHKTSKSCVADKKHSIIKIQMGTFASKLLECDAWAFWVGQLILHIFWGCNIFIWCKNGQKQSFLS